MPGFPKFSLPPEMIVEILQERGKYAETVLIKSKADRVKADPADNVILACAKDGAADFIVSSDHHLLDVREFEGISIVNPAEFCRREGLA